MELEKLIKEVFCIDEVTENYYSIEEFKQQLYKLKNFDFSFEQMKIIFYDRDFNFDKKNKTLMLGSYSFPKLGSFKIIESKGDFIKMESDSKFIINAFKVKKKENGDFHAVKMDIYKK